MSPGAHAFVGPTDASPRLPAIGARKWGAVANHK
jgi:hypothetical protein